MLRNVAAAVATALIVAGARTSPVTAAYVQTGHSTETVIGGVFGTIPPEGSTASGDYYTFNFVAATGSNGPAMSFYLGRLRVSADGGWHWSHYYGGSTAFSQSMWGDLNRATIDGSVEATRRCDGETESGWCETIEVGLAIELLGTGETLRDAGAASWGSPGFRLASWGVLTQRAAVIPGYISVGGTAMPTPTASDGIMVLVRSGMVDVRDNRD